MSKEFRPKIEKDTKGVNEGKLMKIMNRILFILICISATLTHQSCRKENKVEESSYPEPTTITVYFVPMDGISISDVNKLGEDFSKNFTDSKWGQFTVKSFGHSMSPESCLNDSKTRLRADKLLKWLETYKDSAKMKTDKGRINDGACYIIGVTDKDISTSIHGSDDYGILGLSYLGIGNKSIVSTYRLKREKDLWKLAFHEFCHGFYGCPHCPNDNPHCIMADAKGGNPRFEIKDSLCSECAAFILN